MDVFYFVAFLNLAHYGHVPFKLFFTEHGRLSHKTFHEAYMVLGQHGWYGVILGRKLEQRKIVTFRVTQSGHITGWHINIRVFVNRRVWDQFKILESKGVIKI